MLRAGLLKEGAEALEKLLKADGGHRGPRAACPDGHEAEFTGYRGKDFDTVLGPVTVRRAWYHCGPCKSGFAPRDAELGMAGTSMSPGLAVMNEKAAAAEPFGQARDLLEVLAGVTLTGKRVERAAGAGGAALAARERERAGLIAARTLVPLPQSPVPDMLYGVIDGTGCPMTARETAGRQGKGEDGRARTREVRLAVFFNQATLDSEGHPVRDPATSSYIASFGTSAGFADLVKAEAIRRDAERVRQLTFIGDGAAWIRTLVTATFPEATCIVDLFHAREHLHDLAKSLEFILPDKDAWLAARMSDLDNGDIDAIEAAVRVFPLAEPQKTEVEKELAYFLSNAPRMQYKWFRSRGLFVGSGVVEAGCKSIAGARLKRSGMHWTENGADAIIALRCRDASSTRETLCNTPRTQTRTA